MGKERMKEIHDTLQNLDDQEILNETARTLIEGKTKCLFVAGEPCSPRKKCEKCKVGRAYGIDLGL